MARTGSTAARSALGFALCLLPSMAQGDARTIASRVVAAVGRGEFITLEHGQAERLTLASALPERLLGAAPGETVAVEEFPVALGQRRSILLERIDVYARDAKILRADRRGFTELPRSNWSFFLGRGLDDPSTQLALWVDPVTHEIGGTLASWLGTSALRRTRDGSYLVVPSDAGETERFLCGDAPSQEAASAPESALPPDLFGLAAITTLHSATIAVDTDNEFMANKFGNNTTNATNYIASLFAAMNVMYERDLLVRLVQGLVILRTSPDPYLQTNLAGTPPTSAQLNEVATFWNGACGATCTGASRALVTLLSGKQLQSNVAAGIASIGASSPRQNMGVLCSTTSGFSFIEPVNSGSTLSSIDAPVAGHEIGHNFGSRHTHCYQSSPGVFLDGCYNQEGGSCYSGAAFCPAPSTYNGLANVTGTVMGYCNPFFIAGCSTTSVFHPYIVANVLEPNIQAAVGTCISPVASSPTIATISPAVGQPAGGALVTITGTGFQTGASVTFDGLPATSVGVGGATSLTCQTPAHAEGVVDVVVVNPATPIGNGLRGRANDGFTFVTTAVTSVSPASGPLAGGTPVTIKGANFHAGAAVSFGGAGGPPTAVTFVDAQTVTAVTPARSIGPVSVTVTNTDLSTATRANAFFYSDPSPVSDFFTLTPCRLVDTRNPSGPLGGPGLSSAQSRTFTLTGVCGIPADASAVSLNVTVVNPAATGQLSIFPGNAFSFGTNSLSFRAGVTRANNVVMELATDGTGSVGVENASAGLVNVILDVNGFFKP